MSCAIAKPCILWLVLTFPTSDTPTKGATASAARVPPKLAVSVKIRDAANIAFREHRGPYWTVGPEFTRLRHYLDDHDLTAPMFARFLNRPGSVRVADLRTEIGFFVPASHRPDRTFTTDAIKPQMVAYALLGDRVDSTAKDLARIRHWIHENGYEQNGPVMEIYRVQGDRLPDERWETEVQIPVVKRRPGRVASKTPQPVPGADVDPTKDRDRERTSPAASPVGTMSRIPDRAMPATTVPPHSATVDGSVSNIKAAMRPADQPLEKRQPAAIQGAEMIIAGDALAFASAVMPDTQEGDGFDPVWRGHVGLRMIGILRGIERQHPADEAWAGALRQALTDAFDTYASRLPVNPKDLAVVTYGTPPQQTLLVEKEITRALDGLLIRVGRRAAGPDDVKNELGLIVDQLLAPQVATP